MTNANTISLAGLLSLQNEQFVDAAYEILLDREPDSEGRAYYVARLRTGYSKLSILFQLRNSEEVWLGRQVKGLSRTLTRYRLGRWPLIGWLVRRLLNVEGETVSERLQRTIISELADLRTEAASGSFAAASSAGQTKMPTKSSPRSNPTAERRRNLVAEQLSPRAREIFDRLVSS